MFHIFRERDVRVEEMIALAVRSFRIHYPEARLVLLTNDIARTMQLSPDLHLETSVADTPHIMLERVRGYRDYLRTAPAGAAVVFLDTDMLVIRRFDELFEAGIDLAVTVRTVHKMPINGGFILARLARRDRVLAFFDRFYECCAAMPEKQRGWYGDQLALSQLLRSPPLPLLSIVTGERDGLTVRFAPARVFNQTPRPNFLRYGLFRPGARILHFKGARKAEMQRYARRFLSRPYVALRAPFPKGRREMSAEAPFGLLQFVMFYAFRARDAEAEAQIALCARSIASSYPEAQIVLLTNTPDVAAVMSPPVRVEVVDVPSRYVMVERLRAYRNWVKAAPANAVLIFMDTDMLVIRRFDELLEPGADLAVTVRRDPVWPINAGLLVMRGDDRAGVEAFFERLVETCERLNEDERLWYGDQISLAKLLVPTPGRFLETYAEVRDGLTVRFAPSRLYNQTPRPWMMRLGVFRGPARILHFKGNRKHRMELYARIYLSAFARAFIRRRSRR